MIDPSVTDALEYFTKLKQVLEGLNKEFVTDMSDADIDKIKAKITEDLKRELQGRSSYGIGV